MEGELGLVVDADFGEEFLVFVVDLLVLGHFLLEIVAFVDELLDLEIEAALSGKVFGLKFFGDDGEFFEGFGHFATGGEEGFGEFVDLVVELFLFLQEGVPSVGRFD